MKPWLTSLPDDARPLWSHDRIIGWAYQDAVPLGRVDKSLHKEARKQLRWTVYMLDGTLVTRNSRTLAEAARTLRSAIAQRVSNQTI